MENIMPPPLSDGGIINEVKRRNMKKMRKEKRKRQLKRQYKRK